MGIFILNSTNLLNCIRTILPDPEKFYPLHEPKFDCNAAEQVKQCVESGWVSSSGENINKLEETCKEMLQIKYCSVIWNSCFTFNTLCDRSRLRGILSWCFICGHCNAINTLVLSPILLISTGLSCMCADPEGSKLSKLYI